MVNISIEAVLALRQMRRSIIEICEYIYAQKYDMVCESLENLDTELGKIFPENSRYREIMQECRMCEKKGNYLRLKDLLMQEIDSDISDQLYAVSEKDRKLLAEMARKENEEALALNHKDILEQICKKNTMSRIDCSYMGTENISISIIEGNYKFRLFSNENPWLESNGLVYSLWKGELDEIYVLGFGGGHFVGELERRFRGAKINVFLPNIDIFKTVIHNIPVGDLLKNNNINLYHDPICLEFLSAFNKKKEKNIRQGFYIDRQELRAHIKNAELVEEKIKELEKAEEKDCVTEIVERETIGKQIERYILNYIVDVGME